MKDWNLLLILALMIILAIFIEITEWQIDFINDEIDKLTTRIVVLEHKAHIYGLES